MRKCATVTVPVGLVQVVLLHWNKSARGGQGAYDRNTVPSAFAVPEAELIGATGQLAFSEAHFGECNAFAEPFLARSKRFAVLDGFSFGCVKVSGHPDGLLVRFQYNRAKGGAPDRGYLNSLSGQSDTWLVARPGRWVRLCYNGRFSCTDSGNWWYEQATINVAWFSGEPDGRIFLDREPDKELRVMADLR